jgi:selenoprotein W-related protein
LAEQLVEKFRSVVGQPHPIQEIILIPSGGGRFEVMVDGELIYSKAATGVHPEQDFVVEQVRARLAA